MENRGLLFIPDISGFSRFVNEVEIDHSRYIIRELLETLINANETGLEISEIEGDAILFYKFGEPPEIKELFEQVQKMFCSFHRYLISYDQRRICQCKACVSASGLTLKVISHYGEFTAYTIRNFNKLIGKDIIVAHQLLKNDIDQHEYWLVTDSLLHAEPPGLAGWMQWNASRKQTDTGEIAFHYTQLGELKNEIPPMLLRQEMLEKKTKMLSVSREYQRDVKTLFFTVVHFDFRHQWQEGVRSVEEVTHFLPGIGSRFRYVMENGETIVAASSFSYTPEKMVFSETDENDRSTNYVIEQTGPNSSRLTIEYYLPRNPLKQFLFSLKEKRSMQARLKRSMNNLEGFVMAMVVPLEF